MSKISVTTTGHKDSCKVGIRKYCHMEGGQGMCHGEGIHGLCHGEGRPWIGSWGRVAMDWVMGKGDHGLGHGEERSWIVSWGTGAGIVSWRR